MYTILCILLYDDIITGSNFGQELVPVLAITDSIHTRIFQSVDSDFPL